MVEEFTGLELVKTVCSHVVNNFTVAAPALQRRVEVSSVHVCMFMILLQCRCMFSLIRSFMPNIV